MQQEMITNPKLSTTLQNPILEHVIRVPVPAADAPALEQLTDEERTVALCSGAACLRQNRKMLAGATERQMHTEIENGFRAQLDKQAAALTLEKTLSEERQRASDVRLDKEVDTVVRHKTEILDRVLGDKEDQVRRLTELLRDRDLALLERDETLRQQSADRRAKMDEEVAHRVHQHDQMRDAAMRDVLAKNADVLDSVQKQQQQQQQQKQTRTSTEIGAIGEQQFIEIAEKTFVDFEGFQLLDVHAQPHKGDAHIVIKDLTIMVDAKAYSRRVDSSQIEKIKADLRCNEHIPFAWLVSLNTGIDRKDGVAFSFEWIGETQCVVYVNNLLGHTDPGLLLKTLYYLCRDQLVRVRAVGAGADARELATLREDRHQVVDKVVALKKRLREVKSALTGLRNLHADLERDVAGLLNADANASVGGTGGTVHKHYAAISEWWSGYAECVDQTGQDGQDGQDAVLKSPALWAQLKRDHADLCVDMTVAEFKDALCLIVPAANVVRARGKGGGMDILRYRARTDVTVVSPPSEPIVVATECIDAADPAATSTQSY
jgi:hypothetical protein